MSPYSCWKSGTVRFRIICVWHAIACHWICLRLLRPDTKRAQTAGTKRTLNHWGRSTFGRLISYRSTAFNSKGTLNGWRFKTALRTWRSPNYAKRSEEVTFVCFTAQLLKLTADFKMLHRELDNATSQCASSEQQRSDAENGTDLNRGTPLARYEPSSALWTAVAFKCKAKSSQTDIFRSIF